MFKFTSLVSVALFASAAFAHKPTHMQVERFEAALKPIENALSVSRDKAVVARRLVSSDEFRYSLFNLEGLARIYNRMDNDFSKMAEKTGELEDALGEVKKWQKIGDAARAESAEKSLANLLVREEWIGAGRSPRIEKFRETLEDVDWYRPEREKEELMRGLEKQLSKVEDSKYDLSRLETGKGLHKLRRQLRWFQIEARSLNGLVQYKGGDHCTVRAYEHLLSQPIANGDYAKLATTRQEVPACRISKCLFVGMVEAVEQLGLIKDRAEALFARTGKDVLPLDMQNEATKILVSMKVNNLLPALMEEIRACR